MQKKHFYSHIIETSSVSLALGDMELTPQERKELISLVEMNMHKTIMELVLSQLSEEDKRQFLLHVHQDNHEKIWTLLKAKIGDIEERIHKAANDFVHELHKDIADAKKKR